MLKLKKIAITGSVAAGKSQVNSYFKKYGAYTVNSDKIVHKLLSINSPLGKQIIKLLGKDILVNNEINREKIAEKVFSNSEKLKNLEKLIHPYVFDEIKNEYDKAKNEKYNLFVVEMALLFEVGAESFYDYIITVIANINTRKERYKKNDFEKREQRLFPQDKKAKLSNFTIVNETSLEELEKQVKLIIEKLSKN